jgi:hypothetical protein
MENRYLPQRLVFYIVFEEGPIKSGKGNKRKSFIRCRMSLKHIALTRPNVYTSGDILVIDNHLDIKENKESIVKALKNEARKLYPEFKEENIYIKL